MRYILLTAALIAPVAAVAKGPKVDPHEAKCLATTIYGEARGESMRGQIAVAWTVLNRAVSKKICDVVLAPMQYSVYNDNPELREAATSLRIAPKQNNVIDKISWKQATQLAMAVLRREIPDPTDGATHYLNPDLTKAQGYKLPAWAKEFTFVAFIDSHKFFRPMRKDAALY
jgi:N-acetylmuramoyl-L-alanine amidase